MYHKKKKLLLPEIINYHQILVVGWLVGLDVLNTQTLIVFAQKVPCRFFLFATPSAHRRISYPHRVQVITK